MTEQRQTSEQAEPGDATHPVVVLELYGSLRVRTGCEALRLHADTIATAVAVLKGVYPQAARLLPEAAQLGEHYRFSINGRAVTNDPASLLRSGDRVVLFSASVGG